MVTNSFSCTEIIDQNLFLWSIVMSFSSEKKHFILKLSGISALRFAKLFLNFSETAQNFKFFDENAKPMKHIYHVIFFFVKH